jgi:hypothetical protein
MGSPISSPGNGDAAAAAVGRESDGRLVMFVSAYDGNAWPKTVWQSSQTQAGSPTSGSWSQWNPIGDLSSPLGVPPRVLGQPAVFPGSNGALYIFVAVEDLNASRALWWNVETTPGSGQWSVPSMLDLGIGLGQP